MSAHFPIVIISGLPRSGTSLLMQILQAGGVPLLMDKERMADEHNPRGYFEFAPVKKLRQDASWLSHAVGKAVKVVSPLLVELPSGYEYRVLLIERALPEVVASQLKLLATQGVTEPAASAEELLQLYARHQVEIHQTLQSRSDVRFHKVRYDQLITSPANQIAEIADFLQPVWPDSHLDQGAMIEAVEPELYRVRR